VLFGLGAVAMVRYPEGVLAMQARSVRTLLARFQDARPRAYNALKPAALVYALAFVGLIVGAKRMWWLWVVVTLAVGNLVVGYLALDGRRRREGLVPQSLAGGAEPFAEPALATTPGGRR
jgi:hypothetical protein